MDASCGFNQSFHNRVCVLWGYMSNISVHVNGLHLFVFSYMRTLFLHNVFSECFGSFTFMWDVWSCMRTHFYCGASFISVVSIYGKKKQNRCCLVTNVDGRNSGPWDPLLCVEVRAGSKWPSSHLYFYWNSLHKPSQYFFKAILYAFNLNNCFTPLSNLFIQLLIS